MRDEPAVDQRRADAAELAARARAAAATATRRRRACRRTPPSIPPRRRRSWLRARSPRRDARLRRPVRGLRDFGDGRRRLGDLGYRLGRLRYRFDDPPDRLRRLPPTGGTISTISATSTRALRRPVRRSPRSARALRRPAPDDLRDQGRLVGDRVAAQHRAARLGRRPGPAIDEARRQRRRRARALQPESRRKRPACSAGAERGTSPPFDRQRLGRRRPRAERDRTSRRRARRRPSPGGAERRSGGGRDATAGAAPAGRNVSAFGSEERGERDRAGVARRSGLGPPGSSDIGADSGGAGSAGATRAGSGASRPAARRARPTAAGREACVSAAEPRTLMSRSSSDRPRFDDRFTLAPSLPTHAIDGAGPSRGRDACPVHRRRGPEPERIRRRPARVPGRRAVRREPRLSSRPAGGAGSEIAQAWISSPSYTIVRILGDPLAALTTTDGSPSPGTSNTAPQITHRYLPSYKRNCRPRSSNRSGPRGCRPPAAVNVPAGRNPNAPSKE